MTPEELETFQAYQKIAQFRNKTHNQTDYWKSDFTEFQRLVPQGKVLDMGCGGGRDAIMFTQSGYDYLGIDVSSEMINHARIFAPRAQFEVRSMYDLNFPTESFDGFWSIASLIHIPKDNIDQILHSIGRIVKPDGIGFMVMREGEQDLVLEEQTGKRFFAMYTHEEFKTKLEENGFNVFNSRRDERGFYGGKRESAYLCYLVRNHK